MVRSFVLGLVSSYGVQDVGEGAGGVSVGVTGVGRVRHHDPLRALEPFMGSNAAHFWHEMR